MRIGILIYSNNGLKILLHIYSFFFNIHQHNLMVPEQSNSYVEKMNCKFYLHPCPNRGCVNGPHLVIGVFSCTLLQELLRKKPLFQGMIKKIEWKSPNTRSQISTICNVPKRYSDSCIVLRLHWSSSAVCHQNRCNHNWNRKFSCEMITHTLESSEWCKHLTFPIKTPVCSHLSPFFSSCGCPYFLYLPFSHWPRFQPHPGG